MSRGIRLKALALGAGALMSAQIAYAAPATPAAPAAAVQTADPLFTLSMLGSQQSRAAVSAGMPSVMAGSAATTAAVQPRNPPSPGPPLLLIILGGVLFAAVIVAIATSGNGNSDGNLTPVSPD